jgi:signal recognition particle receptor subunit beta
MALINHRAHEIHFKIVYVGPGLGGKTTNLECLHRRLPENRRGKLLTIATDHERTLFFDFMPVDLGQVNGFLTRFHLYTVPGQVYYRLSRRAVLQSADAVVFVADSHPAREQANHESLRDLDENLRGLGLTGDEIRRMPRVFQFNKRDLPAALPVPRLSTALNHCGAPEVLAIATQGIGVNETLKISCKAVLARLAGKDGLFAPGPAAAPGTAGVAATARPGMPPAAATGAAPAAPAMPAPPGWQPV